MTILKHEITAEEYGAIPDNLKPIYATAGDDGAYAVPEGMRGIADAITGLFGANANIRKENKDLAKRAAPPDLSALSQYGTDIPGIAAAIAELETKLAEGAEGKLNLDKVRQEMKAAHGKDLEAKDRSIDALRKSVHTHLVVSGASEALAAEAGIVELALPFVERQVKVVEEDGVFRPIVVDADGDPRISGGTGQPMTVRELVREMKASDKFAPLFRSEAKSGGGTPAHTASKVAQSAKELSPIDKIRAGLAKMNTANPR